MRAASTSAPRVVAIDGAAGSGKSTLARSLAIALHLPYINTGLMYRALTAAALDAGGSLDDEPHLIALMQRLRFSLDDENPRALEVHGWAVDTLVTLEVEANVSTVAKHAGVRTLMRSLQRRLGSDFGAVMEGRDIGAVVFHDAPVKLYLEADLDARAQRRSEERGAGEVPDELVQDSTEQVGEALRLRDRRDAATNPHVPADGAVVIDTTHLDAAQTLTAALAIVAARAPELIP